MIILKPNWIAHYDAGAKGSKMTKSSVYTLHVHPDGSRLATGGQDCTARIWNMNPIFDHAAEADPNCQRLLCTLTKHNGTVLCVRWSNDGKYLASSSDNDNIIVIWELGTGNDTEPNTASDSSDRHHECWQPKIVLSGHESDVQDLAWSKDDRYLASGGVDGYIIVWDGATFEQVTRIEPNGGFVKGLAWDPVGKYLASQSDDKTTKIWRTSDWGLQKQIKEPFASAPGATFFRRLSWSPNGSYIVASNAGTGTHCTAAIIDRKDWSSDLSLLGHKSPVEVALFSPKLFRVAEDFPIASEAAHDKLISICALAGQDRSVSIWATQLRRPLFVVADIFRSTVYDLAWTPDGQNLFACSQDGTIVCLQLKDELRYPATDTAMLEALSEYNNKPHEEQDATVSRESNHDSGADNIPSKRIADPTTTSSMQTTMNANTEQMGNGLAKQLVDTAQKSFPASSTTDVKSTSISGGSPTAKEQKETIRKDGKRRIQPVPVRNSYSPSHQPFHVDGMSQNKLEKMAKGNHDRPTSTHGNGVMHASGISTPLPTSMQMTVSGNKRKQEDTDMEDVSVTCEQTDTEQGDSRKRPVWVDAAVVPPSISQSQMQLHTPMVKSYVEWKFDDNARIECHNATGKDDSQINRLTVSDQCSQLWVDILPASILLATKSKQFYAVSCEDASVHIYSLAGRRLLPPIVLESTPVVLQSRDAWAACLTATGLMYIWDVLKQKSCLDAVSVAPVLRLAQRPTDTKGAGPTIKDVRLLKSGTPIVITNHHQAFVYHDSMKAWTRISDAWYIKSEFWDTTSGETKPDEHPLGWLSSAISYGHNSNSTHGLLDSFSRTDKESVNTITTSHIEIQLAVAAMFNTPSEYKDWLIHYARQLSREGAKSKVQELCRWLVGPPLVPAQEWEPMILGTLSKKEILQELLPIFASNRQLQRIVGEVTSFSETLFAS